MEPAVICTYPDCVAFGAEGVDIEAAVGLGGLEEAVGGGVVAVHSSVIGAYPYPLGSILAQGADDVSAD